MFSLSAGGVVQVSHLLLDRGLLYPHQAGVELGSSDTDPDTGYLWCQFSLNTEPETMWHLDLGNQLYQFYFMGSRNKSG